MARKEKSRRKTTGRGLMAGRLLWEQDIRASSILVAPTPSPYNIHTLRLECREYYKGAIRNRTVKRWDSLIVLAVNGYNH